jgi:hypothetical protein
MLTGLPDFHKRISGSIGNTDFAWEDDKIGPCSLRRPMRGSRRWPQSHFQDLLIQLQQWK